MLPKCSWIYYHFSIPLMRLDGTPWIVVILVAVIALGSFIKAKPFKDNKIRSDFKQQRQTNDYQQQSEARNKFKLMVAREQKLEADLSKVLQASGTQLSPFDAKLHDLSKFANGYVTENDNEIKEDKYIPSNNPKYHVHINLIPTSNNAPANQVQQHIAPEDSESSEDQEAEMPSNKYDQSDNENNNNEVMMVNDQEDAINIDEYDYGKNEQKSYKQNKEQQPKVLQQNSNMKESFEPQSHSNEALHQNLVNSMIENKPSESHLYQLASESNGAVAQSAEISPSKFGTVGDLEVVTEPQSDDEVRNDGAAPVPVNPIVAKHDHKLTQENTENNFGSSILVIGILLFTLCICGCVCFVCFKKLSARKLQQQNRKSKKSNELDKLESTLSATNNLELSKSSQSHSKSRQSKKSKKKSQKNNKTIKDLLDEKSDKCFVPRKRLSNRKKR